MKLLKTSDDVDISYDIDRSGKGCIVLLHGLGGNLTAWNPVRQHLRYAGFKTLAVNLRGHADSGRPHKKSGYNFKRIAKDVEEILDFEKVNKYVLVGHCFGGVIALYIASENQKQVEELILINTTYKKPFSHSLFSNKYTQGFLHSVAGILPEAKYSRPVHFEGYKGTGDHDIKRILSDIIHTSAKSYTYLLAELLSFNAKERLTKINTKTLVLSGSTDSVYPTKISRDLTEKLPHAKLDVLEGENHIVVINNPKLTADKIIEFVRS